jgi:hypothetical protein
MQGREFFLVLPPYLNKRGEEAHDKGGPAYPVEAAPIVVAIMMAISLVVGASARLAYASATFTVNFTGDAADANQGDGTCQTATTGQCTLSAAIQEANTTTDADTINFAIPPLTATPQAGCARSVLRLRGCHSSPTR